MGTNLHNLKAPERSRHRKKRVGRGQGSGLGKTAGRGGKGQKARTGNMNFEGFEGGQMPLQRRLPKFGFKNPFRVEYAPVNLDRLDSIFENGATVSLDALLEKGVLSKKGVLVKILGQGTLGKKLTVHAHGFSASAKEAIENAGGSVVVIERHPAQGTAEA
ncbi:50S ribosomal protein L15 [Vulgatibacter incomptus]|uniref:Large ribosomal subunit protein uL15 n=1 Tax=Vulgatibacter incomptus TaxID=1391653 RepID=A0A0K1PDH3_9BACT|nr:50S ribosomal protein L15 [Vulgatibacter incomptus]AKU91570.1 LSU ribosomal protein L15p (L27Ae) [Vulgatibacter incomptus]